MTGLDWTIVVVYFFGLIGMSYYLSKGQTDHQDYYLGGRNIGWKSVGLSAMATQLGAISFISAPAFVGLRENGGLKWLSYEFGVPLAMIFLISFIVPPLYKSGVVSIYGYLEKRFAGSTSVFVSVVFQISRSLSTGVTIYALALVLSAALGIPIWVTIFITGLVTIIYDMMGGMKAVIYSDVIQMSILFVGIFICSLFALYLLGGWDTFMANLDVTRLKVINFKGLGIGKGNEFGFWPMVIGGFFLYASYYGCDQTQVQRQLSARNLKEVRHSMMLNGLGRFPVVLLYCTMGLFLATFAVTHPAFQAMIPEDNPDMMVPLFIIHYLPAGLTGLLIVAILAAAMSSLDSSLNSLSAASVQDLVVRNTKRSLTNQEHLRYSKLFTLFWGIVCTLMAFAVGNISPTVIEAINKVGSLFFGPILATFILAILTKKTHTLGVNTGLLAGVLLNFGLWIFAGDLVFWFWWNFTGAVTTIVVGYGLSRIIQDSDQIKKVLHFEAIDFRKKETLILTLYFFAIVIFSGSLAFLI